MPPQVLGYDSMAAILRDAHLLEVYFQRQSWFGDSARARGIPLYEALFEKHGIAPARFQQSWDYYRNHPTQLESVYVRVIPLLREAIEPADSTDGRP